MAQGAGLIKNLFLQNLPHLKIDTKLAKKINDFQLGFVNKNEEHMAFFGGNLTGVQVVRFTEQDKNRWFLDIMECDDISMEEQLLEIPVINPKFNVSTDIFNYTCLWLIHAFKNSPLVSSKVKQQAMLDCSLILYYRFLTSLMFRYYKYPVDKRIAEATYAQLSYKFALKRHGTWYGTLEARSLDLIDDSGLHSKTFTDFTDDLKIIYMVNDSQGRIRDMLKNITGEFKKALLLGSKVKTLSSVGEFDGEESLKDSTRNLSKYIFYLNSIVTDKNSFIKQDLVDLVCKIMHTMPPKLFNQTLEWCSVNTKHGSAKEVDTLIKETLTHSFGYLTNNRTVYKETIDMAGIISRLRGVYMSSKSSDTNLLFIRDLSQKIVRQATVTKNDNVISSLKTGLLLYLVIRGLAMNYYSK